MTVQKRLRREVKAGYEWTKSHFLTLRKSVSTKEDRLLSDAKRFFIFCMVTILVVLVFFAETKNEFYPTILLGALSYLFWKKSDTTGKVFLISAGAIGYAHEVIGVVNGWFTYAGGFFYGTPLWLIPGYGCIYWSCYNLWLQGKKKYHLKQERFKKLAIVSIALLFILDFFFFKFRPTYMYDIPFFVLIILLFTIRPGEQHLAYITGFMTLTDEYLGHVLGAWTHPSFVITALLPSYILFLWGALRVSKFLDGEPLLKRSEVIIASLAILIKIKLWFF